MAVEEKKILELLKQKFPKSILEVATPLGDEVAVIDGKALLAVVQFMKDKPHEYSMLLDLTCIDYLEEDPRFEMVYHLFSLTQNKRLRIKAKLSEKDPRIPSLTPLWKNANWLEREVFDLFGIYFEGHPDLRRIFMYEEFEGYPLRKDYSLRHRQPRIRLRE